MLEYFQLKYQLQQNKPPCIINVDCVGSGIPLAKFLLQLFLFLNKKFFCISIHVVKPPNIYNNPNKVSFKEVQ